MGQLLNVPVVSDEWLRAAAVLSVRARRIAYSPARFVKAPEMAVAEIALTQIALPTRRRAGGPFDRWRMLDILRALKADGPLQPVEVDTPPTELCECPFRLAARGASRW
jgi:hypothetical protein